MPLHIQGKTVHCESAHSFDIAKSGYLNLLQPQDRKSKNPGDTAEAVAARRRIHDLGVTQPLREGIAAMLAIRPDDALFDVGCGEGFYCGGLPCDVSGIDLSVAAIDAAARRYPGGEWIVGNADRAIPYAENSFSVITSITARMNPAEFRRVLRDDGRLLVAVAAPDDLIEIRGAGKDRVARTIEEFSASFALRRTERVTTSAELDAAAVEDIRHSIYRPLHAEPATAMRITFSLDLLLFAPSSASSTQTTPD